MIPANLRSKHAIMPDRCVLDAVIKIELVLVSIGRGHSRGSLQLEIRIPPSRSASNSQTLLTYD